MSGPTIKVYTRVAFFDHLSSTLPIDRAAFDKEWTLWEIGLDSSLVIELVFAIEDIGVSMPDDLRWDRLTPESLYDVYLTEATRRA